MDDPRESERPCIHVTLLEGTDAGLFRWAQMGAEEEGVPCRQVKASGADVVAWAYDAAQSSRFGIGLAVSPTTVVLHERHMPPAGPVMAVELADKGEQFCRMMGANAARMVIRKPLRFADDEEPRYENKKAHPSWRQKPDEAPPPAAAPETLTGDPALIAAIAARVIIKLQERGIQ